MPVRIDIDMAQVRELHTQGKSLKEIACAIGCCYSTLHQKTRAADIQFAKTNFCARGLHDLTLPNAKRAGKQCRLCYNSRNRERTRIMAKKRLAGKARPVSHPALHVPQYLTWHDYADARQREEVMPVYLRGGAERIRQVLLRRGVKPT